MLFQWYYWIFEIWFFCHVLGPIWNENLNVSISMQIDIVNNYRYITNSNNTNEIWKF